MDTAQHNDLKEQLIRLRERFSDEVTHREDDSLSRSPRDQAGDLSGYAIHLADSASDEYNREFSLSLASREQNILYEIDEALRRMEEGNYGACESCSRPIAIRRLETVPYARLCVACKEQEEKEGRTAQ